MVYISYIIENYRECRNIIGYTEKGGITIQALVKYLYVLSQNSNLITNNLKSKSEV